MVKKEEQRYSMLGKIKDSNYNIPPTKKRGKRLYPYPYDSANQQQIIEA